MLGNAAPAEANKPYEHISAFDPDLRSKAQVLANDTYDPSTDSDEMIAARLQAYSVLVPIEGVTGAITTVNVAANDAFDAFTELKAVLNMHFMNGEMPIWVESNDPDLEQMLSKRWSVPAGRPSDWQEIDKTTPALTGTAPTPTNSADTEV